MEKDVLYIKELALGSHDAFKRLFMNYFPKVKYFIEHLVKSEIIAEELAQDVFMKIWDCILEFMRGKTTQENPLV